MKKLIFGSASCAVADEMMHGQAAATNTAAVQRANPRFIYPSIGDETPK
jgi:hypothetical protein